MGNRTRALHRTRRELERKENELFFFPARQSYEDFRDASNACVRVDMRGTDKFFRIADARYLVLHRHRAVNGYLLAALYSATGSHRIISFSAASRSVLHPQAG